MVLEHLCPEVVEVPWQGGPLHVWIGLPHIRVVGVVRWVVVVLARKVEVVCNSVVSELITVLQKGLKSSTCVIFYVPPSRNSFCSFASLNLVLIYGYERLRWWPPFSRHTLENMGDTLAYIAQNLLLQEQAPSSDKRMMIHIINYVSHWRGASCVFGPQSENI